MLWAQRPGIRCIAGGVNVKYRALTVAREFGSGGGRIANTIAGWLGWRLLDQEIITAIAHRAKVDPHVVSHYDEHADSWFRRINEEAIRGVALASGQPVEELDIFDAHVMTELTRRIIEEAYTVGNCVIVGRGAQCILANRPDVFHVFVYAPFQERIHRLESRLPKGVNIEHRIRTVDEERTRYLSQRFGKQWSDPHLYDLMIRSHQDENATAKIILEVMNGQS